MKLLLIAAALITSLAAIACNDDGSANAGGGTLSLEEYFDELDRISENAEAESDSIDAPDLSADASFEEARDAFIAYFEQSADIVEDAVADVGDLDEPDDVSDEHSRFVDALSEISVAFSAFVDSMEDADEDEFDNLLGGDDPFEDIDTRVTAACLELQKLADDNEIDVDLECEEDA